MKAIFLSLVLVSPFGFQAQASEAFSRTGTFQDVSSDFRLEIKELAKDVLRVRYYRADFTSERGLPWETHVYDGKKRMGVEGPEVSEKGLLNDSQFITLRLNPACRSKDSIRFVTNDEIVFKYWSCIVKTKTFRLKRVRYQH